MAVYSTRVRGIPPAVWPLLCWKCRKKLSNPPSPSLPSRAFSSTVLATMFSSSILMLSGVTVRAADGGPGPPGGFNLSLSSSKHRPPPPPTAQPRSKN